jgi:hypothetical protein
MGIATGDQTRKARALMATKLFRGPLPLAYPATRSQGTRLETRECFRMVVPWPREGRGSAHMRRRLHLVPVTDLGAQGSVVCSVSWVCFIVSGFLFGFHFFPLVLLGDNTSCTKMRRHHHHRHPYRYPGTCYRRQPCRNCSREHSETMVQARPFHFPPT